MNTVISFFIFLVVIGGGIYLWYWVISRSRRAIKKASATNKENAQQRTAVAQETGAMPAGKYLTGHPTIATPVVNVSVGFKDANAIILSQSAGKLLELGTIPLAAITNIAAEDHSAMERRPTFSGYLALGNLAALQTQKVIRHYVTIEWKDGRFSHETIFEFEGKNSPAMSNALRSRIIQQANAVEAQ